MQLHGAYNIYPNLNDQKWYKLRKKSMKLKIIDNNLKS